MEMVMEMDMDGGEAAASWWKLMMMETAKEELQKLESNHPNQFEFFKIELKSFIPLHNDLPTSSIATQASTSGMKRTRDEVPLHHRRHQRRRRRHRRHSTSTNTSQDSTGGMMERRGSCLLKEKREKVKEDESVEVALERAKACLQKIQDLKTHLLIS